MKIKIKKFLFMASVLMMLTSGTTQAQQSCPTIQTPSQVHAEQVLLALGVDFTLSSGNQRVGAIIQRTLNWTTTFELRNSDNALVATARERFFSWGTTIDVSDCHGTLIGTLREQILRSWFRMFSVYSILDAQGRQLGTSDRVEYLTLNFNIRDNQGRDLASLRRPFWTLIRDQFDIQIYQQTAIDPRLYLMIPGFKAAADHYRSNDD